MKNIRIIKVLSALFPVMFNITACNNINQTSTILLNNEIDLGNSTNNIVTLNLNHNNFSTKAINDAFNSNTLSVDHYKIALLRTLTPTNPSPVDIFNDSQSMKFNISNANTSSFKPLDIKNLKADSYYYFAVRAYLSVDDSVNITSIDGNSSSAGGGTTGTIDTGSGNEYITVDSAGQLTVNNDGTSVKSGIDNSPNNRIDIELQLMKSLYGSITNNTVNFSAGQPTLPAYELNTIPNKMLYDITASTNNTFNKSNVDIAGSINQNFVVTWVSEGQDGSGKGIFAQLFNKDNIKMGNEFQVNLSTSSIQTNPKVTMTNSGNFIITWQSNHLGEYNIYAKIYGPNGSVIKDEFLVNSATPEDQVNPQIAFFTDDSFVIAWQEDQVTDSNIYFKKFDSSGNDLTGDILANNNTANYQVNPTIATKDDTGEILLGWEYDRNNLNDGSTDIYVRRFNSSGSPLASEFLVSKIGQMYNKEPIVFYNNSTGLNENTFNVYWSNKNMPTHELYSKTFDSLTGVAKTEKFEKSLSSLAPTSPKTIAIDEKNKKLISWFDNNETYFMINYLFLDNKSNLINDTQVLKHNINDNFIKAAYAKNKYIVTWVDVDNNNVNLKVLNNFQ